MDEKIKSAILAGATDEEIARAYPDASPEQRGTPEEVQRARAERSITLRKSATKAAFAGEPSLIKLLIPPEQPQVNPDQPDFTKFPDCGYPPTHPLAEYAKMHLHNDARSFRNAASKALTHRRTTTNATLDSFIAACNKTARELEAKPQRPHG